MKKTCRYWLVPVLALSAGVSWGRSGPAQCEPNQSAVIDAETRCFANGGMDINYYGDGGVKVACMEDKRVKSACGPDGSLTRQQAFHQWYAKLQAFQVRCESEGGTFAFEDPEFIEPQNESYCLPAQPEVGTSALEDTTCNYRSVCPAITVTCETDCHSSQAQMSGAWENQQARLPGF